MKDKINIAPLLPLAFILILMGAAFATSYFYPLSWKTMNGLQAIMVDFHDRHPVWTPLLFMALYIFCALISFPGIFILSLLAGILFVQPFSTFYVTVAATIGSSLVFLAARTAFGELLLNKAGPRLDHLQKGFQANATSYLLFLRLFPFFPYWLVNLAGAYFSVPFRTFAWTTFIGMIPSVYIYAEAGEGFFHLVNHPMPLSPFDLLNLPLVIALTALSLLSLIPLLAKRFNFF